MNEITMTKHARTRKQQRCVPPLVIDWLLTYGRREQSFNLTKVWFDRRAKKELAADVGYQVLSHLSKYMTAALVVEPGTDTVVTVEWLH